MREFEGVSKIQEWERFNGASEIQAGNGIRGVEKGDLRRNFRLMKRRK